MTKHGQPARRYDAKRPEDEPEPAPPPVPGKEPGEDEPEAPASRYIELGNG